MVRIDSEQKREFKAAAGFALLLAIILILPACGIFKPNLGFVDYLPEAVFAFEFAVFAAIFVLLIIALIVANRKASKKIHDVANVHRTTEGIFDLDDPQSVLETLVLYQDYTSERLFRDLRIDNYCERIIFNMLVKRGWLAFEDGCLFVSQESDNYYIKKLYLEPIQNTLRVAEIAERAFNKVNKGYILDELKKEYVFQEELPEKQGMHGKVTAYHLEEIKEFFEKLQKLASKVKDDFILKEDKSAFEDAGIEMNGLFVDHEDEIILVERDVRQKYFVDKKGNSATHRFSPILAISFFLLLFAAILVGTHVAYDSFCGADTLSMTAISFEFLGAYFLSLMATYVLLVNEEKSEKLNEEGKAIVDKISGLKNFIHNYTQLKDPTNDNLYVIWNEFVFFAHMFGLSSKLYDVAKENNKTFDNEGILDYFKDTDCIERVFALNKQVCVDVAGNFSHVIYSKYHYESKRSIL